MASRICSSSVSIRGGSLVGSGVALALDENGKTILKD